MEKIFEFFFLVAFEAFIAIDSEIFYSFDALLPSESLIKRSRFISRGVYCRIAYCFFGKNIWEFCKFCTKSSLFL